MNQPIKVLQLATVDVTVAKLLLPLIDALHAEGYEVEAACADGQYVQALQAQGYKIHTVSLKRKVALIVHFSALLRLYRLVKQESYDIVHVHTPVASVLGRIAAKLAGVPIVIYTAHGFYFHEHMQPLTKVLIIWIEKIMGCLFTDMIFTQSKEDMDTALEKGLSRRENILWIGNGVNPQRFTEVQLSKELKASLGFQKEDKIVGFIGRIVREKGIEELLLAMQRVVQEVPQAKLLVIGDTLESDRDKKAKEKVKQLLCKRGLEDNVRLAGHREDIPELLVIIDLFVLPSHREGMPRSIIEAMAGGKPVIATNIRGCREEVIDGITGFLVPIKNPEILAEKILFLLKNEKLAKKMGKAGRERVEKFFDERMVLQRQISVYRRLIKS